jgi:hypothetical protein
LALAPGGTTTRATGDFNGSIYWWDLAAHNISVTPTSSRDKSITAVVFGPGCTSLVTGDASTYLWHLTMYRP